MERAAICPWFAMDRRPCERRDPVSLCSILMLEGRQKLSRLSASHFLCLCTAPKARTAKPTRRASAASQESNQRNTPSSSRPPLRSGSMSGPGVFLGHFGRCATKARPRAARVAFDRCASQWLASAPLSPLCPRKCASSMTRPAAPACPVPATAADEGCRSNSRAA